MLTIIKELIGFRPESGGTDLAEGLRCLTNVLKKRSTAFVLSDFLDTTGDRADFEDALKIASGKHDLVGIRVYDRREAEMPDVGIVELRDAETGERVQDRARPLRVELAAHRVGRRGGAAAQPGRQRGGRYRRGLRRFADEAFQTAVASVRFLFLKNVTRVYAAYA